MQLNSEDVSHPAGRLIGELWWRSDLNAARDTWVRLGAVLMRSPFWHHWFSWEGEDDENEAMDPRIGISFSTTFRLESTSEESDSCKIRRSIVVCMLTMVREEVRAVVGQSNP